VIPRIAERIRRVLRQARLRRGPAHQRPTGRRDLEREVKRELASEIPMEELREFLEGDIRPPAADPVFKEQLRADLWEMVQKTYPKDSSDKDN